MSAKSKKIVFVAIGANAAIAVSKFAVALFTGSSAMLSEAFHSSVDTGNEVLLWFGNKRSDRPPDRRHPFGHGKELYFWSLIVAIFIFALGGGLSTWEGVSRLLHPRPLEDPTWNYIVLGIAACFEGYTWHIARRELDRRKRSGEKIWDVIRRSKDPSVFTVFLEDSAALTGIALAAAGIFLAHWLNRPYIDAFASIAIGVLLAGVAILLARESGELLVGETADAKRMEAVRNVIQSDVSVERVGDLLTMQLGPEQVFLAVNIHFRAPLGIRELESAVDRLESCIRAQYSEIKRIYIEAESFKQQESGSGSSAA